MDISDEETNINKLMYFALDRLVSLPHFYTMGKFRNDAGSGAVKKENLNCHYWRLRSKINGFKPPIWRHSGQLDAAADAHQIVNGDDIIAYYLSAIYTFQFYRALCSAAGIFAPCWNKIISVDICLGQYDEMDPSKPLHQCNFYGSKKAGDKLGAMLSLGKSKPWPEAMKMMTGQRRTSTEPIREYFAPLEAWLRRYNRENNVPVGWTHSDSAVMCSDNKSK